MKAKVGIDDVAYSLGYRLDKKAGVGKYIELVLGDPARPTDKIVVRNSSDKAQQFYFRRDGSKGDVISFVRENINSFNAPGKNEWSKIANVLARLSNTPIPEVPDKKYVSAVSNARQSFDPARYHTQSIDPSKGIPFLLRNRGFSDECISDFRQYIVYIKDTQFSKYDGLNIGFPYTNPANDALSGYEIRGNKGFKSKAAGTDSAHSAWFAEFPGGNPLAINNVFFFESSFDAMAFYQINKAKLMHSPFALVSVGGAFGKNLAESIIERYPAAKCWDCFDNDLAGQMYAATLVKASSHLDFDLQTKDDAVTFKFGDKVFQSPKEKFDFRSAAQSLGICHSCGHWKSPDNYKDWNDCLLGKEIQATANISKYLRDENLANQRQAKFKM